MSDHGVGMPHALKLNLWGLELANVFGTHSVYQVGSSITSRDYHDVDVRVLLEDDEYDRWFAPCPNHRSEHQSSRWVGVCLAFSLWGQQATGLPIDFQVQRIREANELYTHGENKSNYRSCITLGWAINAEATLSMPYTRYASDPEEANRYSEEGDA